MKRRFRLSMHIIILASGQFVMPEKTDNEPTRSYLLAFGRLNSLEANIESVLGLETIELLGLEII